MTNINEVNHIVDTMKANAHFHANAQPVLRQYVTDKSFPLAERFQVWVAHCDKEQRDCVLARGDFGIIGDLVRDNADDYERYRTYTWEDFLEYADDSEYMPVEQMMEVLIETNFGSFVMDW